MSFTQLMQTIKKKKAENLYCFYGAESYIADQAIKQLRETYIEEAYQDFNDTVVDASKTPLAEVITQWDTLPFFSDKRLVVIKSCSWFASQKTGLDEEDEIRLIDYLVSPSPDAIVVILADSVDKRKKVTKALQKSATLVDCQKIDEQELRKIMTEKLNDSGCEISQENLQYCIYLLGYLEKDSDRTLYDLMSQMDKLIASANAKVITKELLTKVLEKPLDTNIFAFLDALSDGKSADAIRMKQQLLSDDLNDVQMTSMIYKHFRNLYKTTLWLEKGYNPTVIAERLGVHPFSAKKYASQCRQFKTSYLKQAVIDLATLDFRMKSGQISFETALDLMTISLSKRIDLPL